MRVVPYAESLYAFDCGYYSKVLHVAAKGCFGMQWDPVKRQWYGPKTSVSAIAVALRERGVTVDDAAINTDNHLVPFKIPEKGRRDYQLKGARFLLEKRHAILADDMGLGKTCTSLTAARAVANNLLVVCPSYVRGVWEKELAKWWPAAGKTAFFPNGTKGSDIQTSSQVVVIHYDILYAWVDAICSWNPDAVIFDEAHALMSAESKRSRAARSVSKDTAYRWALTGTPLTNRPKDIWNVVDTVSPGALGTFFQFAIRFCDAHQEQVTPTKTVWKFDGKSNLEELHWRLQEYMLRRTRADVALELPPKTRQIHSVQVPAKARVMVDEKNAGALRLALDSAANAKMPDALDLVKELASQGHKVIAFTHRRSTAEYIYGQAILSKLEAELVHGGIPTLSRGAAISRAEGSKEGHILAATIDSAGVGIDLSYADVVVFIELTWEPHKLLQAEARAHRFGQTKPVLIYYVIASGTTDELVADVVIRKLDTYEKVIGSEGSNLKEDLGRSDADVMSELYAAIEKSK